MAAGGGRDGGVGLVDKLLKTVADLTQKDNPSAFLTRSVNNARVSCVCYSEYLSGRDYNHFKEGWGRGGSVFVGRVSCSWGGAGGLRTMPMTSGKPHDQ